MHFHSHRWLHIFPIAISCDVEFREVVLEVGRHRAGIAAYNRIVSPGESIDWGGRLLSIVEKILNTTE
jgi:hypothetical protein